ncbi:peptidylprolyl isomerase [Gangjinia marincola]|uniref:Periplasmic chaperone PpiD n=1 Tax=Gangjinia marincola TaxID=578463 RepID=A0ABN1MH71_9FLAO
MAVLNNIRKRSFVLIMVIALALFAFILADLFRNSGAISEKSGNLIGLVGDEEISREEFARQVEAANQGGRAGSTTQTVNRVWDATVRQLVLENQFEELGIQVGEAQINAMLQQQLAGNPNFSNEAGIFDQNKLREYVSTLKATSPEAYQSWLQYEENVATNAKSQIYFNMIKAGIGATLFEGEQAYQLENSSVDIEYVQLGYDTINDEEVEVTKAEIEAYLKKNVERYKAEATRDIQYVYFEDKPSLDDDNQTKAGVESVLKDKIEYNDVTKLNDTVQSFVDVGDVESFVNEYSDVKYDGRFKFKKDLPRAFADTIYALEEGALFGPYKDNGSWNVSRIVETKQLPDSVRSSHILIAYQGAVRSQAERTKEEAEQLADSLFNIVKANKRKLAELAPQFSDDSSNKDKGGDLDFTAYGRMAPEFNDYIFENKIGDLDLVETVFGYHIINITDQKNLQKALKVATVSRAIESSEKTTSDLFTEATSFEMSAKKDGFTEALGEEYKARPVKGVKSLDENIPGVGAQRNIVQWAFNEETKVGDIKRFDVNGGYVVAQVSAAKEKGTQNADDAALLVTPILKNKKKAELLKKRMSGKSLEEIAKDEGANIKESKSLNLTNPSLSGSGFEPKVAGVAFGLEEGEMSNAIEGTRGVYKVKVVKKTVAPGLDNYQVYAVQQTNKRTTPAVTNNVVNALKKTIEIEDNRAKFY